MRAGPSVNCPILACVERPVSGLILNLSSKRAEAEASSENGPTITLVGGTSDPDSAGKIERKKFGPFNVIV